MKIIPTLLFPYLLNCLVVSVAIAVEPLPLPTGIPASPPGAIGQALGGNRLPTMSGKPARGAPAISMASDITFPDETLVVTGDNLEGVRLRMWAEGVVREVTPLKTASNKLLAVVPKDFPASTMLLWPTKDNRAGEPIRINSATAWWLWPCRAEAGKKGQVLKIIGKCLTLPGVPPKLHLSGPGVTAFLPIRRAEPYSLEAEIPAELMPGTYLVQVHNGTGGTYGWSELLSFHVAAPTARSEKCFPVTDFGVEPNSPNDAHEGITRAIRAAETEAGVVVFAPGNYRLSKPLVIGKTLTLQGAGMGEHDPKTHELAGQYTRLACLDPARVPPQLLVVQGSGAVVRDLTLHNDHPGMGDPQCVLAVHARDVTVRRVRCIMLDRRDPSSWKENYDKRRKTYRGGNQAILTGAIEIDVGGTANVDVLDCEVMSCGAGVRTGGGWGPGHMESESTPPSTDYVRIHGLKYRGYYLGTPSKTSHPLESGRASGIVVNNAKNLIVEGCDFAAADRYHGQCMNRTLDIHHTSNRYLYIAHNRSMDCGPHPSAGMHTNQGEQILFHLHYPQGGLFDVIDARADAITVRTDNILPREPQQSWGQFVNNANSRVIDEVGSNTHWVLTVCAGRGVGQYRQIASREDGRGEVSFRVTEPWRVLPDATSRVVLHCAYRNNIIYHNVIDTGRLELSSKSHGVCFWYTSIENIVAENTFRNLTSGVVWNSMYRNPTAWNTTRDNTIENIFGNSGDTSQRAAAYVDHFRGSESHRVFPPDPRDRVWYSVGNVCRSNRATNVLVAAFLHTRSFDRLLAAHRKQYGQLPVHEDGGIVMSVIEHNSFTGCDEGIQLGGPTLWAVIRNNTIQTRDAATAPVHRECDDACIHEPVIVP